MSGQTNGKTKILVVDDDPWLREMLRALFTRESHEVHDSADAAAGLKKAGETLPQLIVLDMRMPLMSGLEFIKAAKASPEIRHIPIIVLTGQSSTSSGYECLRAGATAYFEKPLDLDPFRRKVNEVLGHQAVR
jgi:CheY-like chemotaxis protein